MITQILHHCGLYLGAVSELPAPAADNQDGFWENARFLAINNDLLMHLGGGWDLVPPLQAGWESSPQLLPLWVRAVNLIRDFAGHDPWGWKDPRNSLTLPFWQRVIPGLKVVVVLRNPLAVCRSLSVRNGFSTMAGLALWTAYHARLLEATRPSERLVTHYDAYFAHPQAEVERVASFLGLRLTEGALAAACTVPKAGLRHNRVPTEDLVIAPVPEVVLGTYLALCAEAGPILSDLLGAELAVAARGGHAPCGVRCAWETAALQARLAEAERALAGAVDTCRTLQVEATDLRRQVTELQARLAYRRYRLADRAARFYRALRAAGRVLPGAKTSHHP